MRVEMIAAITPQRVLAAEGKIPWHLPRDIRHFRTHTGGRQMVVGRRTYEEMRGWFAPERPPIVLTRRRDYRPEPSAPVATDVEEALTQADQLGHQCLMVLGGGEVYAAFLPHAHQLILTVVETRVEKATALFPEFDTITEWQLTREEHHEADEENSLALTFQWWERRAR